MTNPGCQCKGKDRHLLSRVSHLRYINFSNYKNTSKFSTFRLLTQFYTQFLWLNLLIHNRTTSCESNSSQHERNAPDYMWNCLTSRTKKIINWLFLDCLPPQFILTNINTIRTCFKARNKMVKHGECTRFAFISPALRGRVIWGHWPRETGSTDSVRAT